jgi:hypothetical protein
MGVARWGIADGTAATQVNRVVVHPTLPLAVTAHEDKYLRFFDTASGACRDPSPASLPHLAVER